MYNSGSFGPTRVDYSTRPPQSQNGFFHMQDESLQDQYQDGGYCLYVKDLTLRCTEPLIKSIFGDRRIVLDVKLHHNHDKNGNRISYDATVKFQNRDDAASAKEELHGYCVDGSRIRVYSDFKCSSLFIPPPAQLSPLTVICDPNPTYPGFGFESGYVLPQEQELTYGNPNPSTNDLLLMPVHHQSEATRFNPNAKTFIPQGLWEEDTGEYFEEPYQQELQQQAYDDNPSYGVSSAENFYTGAQQPNYSKAGCVGAYAITVSEEDQRRYVYPNCENGSSFANFSGVQQPQGYAIYNDGSYVMDVSGTQQPNGYAIYEDSSSAANISGAQQPDGPVYSNSIGDVSGAANYSGVQIQKPDDYVYVSSDGSPIMHVSGVQQPDYASHEVGSTDGSFSGAPQPNGSAYSSCDGSPVAANYSGVQQADDNAYASYEGNSVTNVSGAQQPPDGYAHASSDSSVLNLVAGLHQPFDYSSPDGSSAVNFAAGVNFQLQVPEDPNVLVVSGSSVIPEVTPCLLPPPPHTLPQRPGHNFIQNQSLPPRPRGPLMISHSNPRQSRPHETRRYANNFHGHPSPRRSWNPRPRMSQQRYIDQRDIYQPGMNYRDMNENQSMNHSYHDIQRNVGQGDMSHHEMIQRNIGQGQGEMQRKMVHCDIDPGDMHHYEYDFGHRDIGQRELYHRDLSQDQLDTHHQDQDVGQRDMSQREEYRRDAGQRGLDLRDLGQSGMGQHEEYRRDVGHGQRGLDLRDLGQRDMGQRQRGLGQGDMGHQYNGQGDDMRYRETGQHGVNHSRGSSNQNSRSKPRNRKQSNRRGPWRNDRNANPYYEYYQEQGPSNRARDCYLGPQAPPAPPMESGYGNTPRRRANSFTQLPAQPDEEVSNTTYVYSDQEFPVLQ